jgi:hypothetical protein
VWTKESSINISVLQKEVLVPVLKELSTMPWRRMGNRLQIQVFITLTLNDGKWSALYPSCFTSGGKRRQYLLDKDKGLGEPQSQCGQKDILPLPEMKPWVLSHPSLSQLLYWLSYPSSFQMERNIF